ncbi:hypothetical protein C8046_09680 [Serinibacter arcticus]|uniref:VWFA domain-containing protein n=1 Tax=Serinibacter arcticus TaxID=1655435 RepID=A0A2U1ZV91_9MICO|nr:VWA domain-containing protein [Serinibacter arcticus]PWD50881.1 hypothetical protein C8046_09680 [Serinibacter arcticus]
MSTPRLLGTVATAVALLAGLLAPVAATAAPDSGAAAEDAQLLVVLDSSSSMLEPASDGGTRADAAKNALLGVVDTLGEDERVGLRTFGATVVGLDDPASCTDSQLTVPIATDNRQALRDAANAYLPYGETPIGFALQQAGTDLTAAGSDVQRTVLLISDGESNCQPDPCAVARDLAAQGIDLTIHVVGFDVSGAARDALVCIANAGGGQYFDVTDTTGLTSVFEKVSTRAFRDFALDGQEVVGTADAPAAPTLTPGTRYITYLPAPGSALNYQIERTIPGSRLWVSLNATAQISAQSLLVEIYPDATAEGSRCDHDLSFPSTWGGSWSLTTMSLSSTSREECTAAGTQLLRVENWLDSTSADGAPAEVLVIEEPPVRSTDALPPFPAETTPWVEPAAVTPQPVLGGTTLSGATPVAAGSYRLDLMPGETALFRVPLDWGQSLQARSSADVGTSFTLFSPTRLAVTGSLVEPPIAEIDPDPTSPPRIAGLRTPPVTYLAREKTGTVEESMLLAGDYTLAVTRAVCGGCGQDPGPVPVILDVLVDGEVSGVPEYVEAAVTSSATPSPSVSTTASATPPPPGDSPTSSETPEASEDDGGLPVAVPVAVGVLGLALLGGGTWTLVRRRRSGA